MNKNSMGMMALLLVVLVDAGLVIWYWNRHQAPENLGSIDLNLPPQEVPQPESEIPPAPASTNRPRSGPAQTPASTLPPRSSPPRPSSAYRSPVNLRALTQALPSFWGLLRKSKYRNSRTIHDWNKDFHAYPDLRAINARFQRDHDTMSFLVSTVQSTNFAKMVAKYGPRPDAQSFLRDSMADPNIAGATQELFRDKRIEAAMKNMAVPGFPSIGMLMQMGTGSTAPNAAKTMEQMKNDPNLKKYMEQQGLPPVSLQ